MSRQIQIRRGTAAEHENFTGAIGEITMDTTNKTLRVHDGETAGGTILAKQSEIPDIANADYVVESQLPTAENNYTWYRKYKSGWVEQGGVWNGDILIVSGHDNIATITMPCIMNDANYSVIISGARQYCMAVGAQNRTFTQFQAIFVSYTETRHLTEFAWVVYGK